VSGRGGPRQDAATHTTDSAKVAAGRRVARPIGCRFGCPLDHHIHGCPQHVCNPCAAPVTPRRAKTAGAPACSGRCGTFGVESLAHFAAMYGRCPCLLREAS